MTRTLVVLLLVVACLLSSHAQERLDAPLQAFRIPNPVSGCALATVILELAKAARIAVGVEDIVKCRGTWVDVSTPAMLATSQDATGLTPRQVLNFVVAQYPNYGWTEMDGVAVVRPIRGSKDSVTVLDDPARAFMKSAADTRNAVNAVLGSVLSGWVAPNVTVGYPQLDRRTAVAFRGGSMLDALNAVVVARGEASWKVDYIPLEYPTETNVFTSIHTHDGGIVGVGAYLSQFKASQR